MARTTAHQSMFGENFKYILVLTILAWMVYTLPSVREALAAASTDSASSTAAVLVAQIRGLPGHGSQEPQKKDMTPDQVVTLLYKLGFISQDKLDAARAAVKQNLAGSSTPLLPCIATSTANFQGTSTMPFPCREIDNGHMPRLGTTTSGMPMMQKSGDRR